MNEIAISVKNLTKTYRVFGHPGVILAGKQINGAKVNVLGITFKENVPDLRNSKAVDLIREMASYGMEIHVHDPVADPAEARHEYGVDLQGWDALPQADTIVAAVAHRAFLDKSVDEYCGLCYVRPRVLH